MKPPVSIPDSLTSKKITYAKLSNKKAGFLEFNADRCSQTCEAEELKKHSRRALLVKGMLCAAMPDGNA